ncbi:MAG TPA: isoprenylcysteine carboxylmethyltransferase family protein [Acidobacteriaceae bacterium]|jgi:protein-S-isoprenylcysteine O-methyltransferase Ste14|nr:isoprenylcysteine carboxylmethyltransferase family protein [Acidobacteriaceae bacterium]
MTNPVRLLLRVPVPWVFVLAYLIGLIPQHLLPRRSITASAAHSITLIGVAVFIPGAIVAAWGLLLFHRGRTTTTPGESSRTFVTRGPYRFTRNPMYIGLTLAYLGEAGYLHQVWPLAFLPFVLAYLNWTVIPLEESRLSATFGIAYNDYRARVRRWI